MTQFTCLVAQFARPVFDLAGGVFNRIFDLARRILNLIFDVAGGVLNPIFYFPGGVADLPGDRAEPALRPGGVS